jgi:hypothetical protein
MAVVIGGVVTQAMMMMSLLMPQRRPLVESAL